MIFEIEEIPEGGLNFDVLEGKEHFEIDQSVRANGQIIPTARNQVVQVADGGVLA